VPAASAEPLRAHVWMLSETLAPRSHEDLENLERAADCIAERFGVLAGGVEGAEGSAAATGTAQQVRAEGPLLGGPSRHPARAVAPCDS
jgi:hypothetical protein